MRFRRVAPNGTRGDPIWWLTAKEYAYSRLTKITEGCKRLPSVITVCREVRELRKLFVFLAGRHPGLRLRDLTDDTVPDAFLDDRVAGIAVREPATWDAAGQPLCPNCLIRDPVNLEVCVGCGRRRPVAVRLADGVRCPSCRPKEIQECGHCGRTAPCEVSRAPDSPGANAASSDG
ncbi:hypothetical protein [Streptomyces milbemycinicus]|uniref:hypothetical protein n=1 Tax=Streptomyces milbemycinicus TaxID=476552 RepID=UPI003409D2DD